MQRLGSPPRRGRPRAGVLLGQSRCSSTSPRRMPPPRRPSRQSARPGWSPCPSSSSSTRRPRLHVRAETDAGLGRRVRPCVVRPGSIRRAVLRGRGGACGTGDPRSQRWHCGAPRLFGCTASRHAASTPWKRRKFCVLWRIVLVLVLVLFRVTDTARVPVLLRGRHGSGLEGWAGSGRNSAPRLGLGCVRVTKR